MQTHGGSSPPFRNSHLFIYNFSSMEYMQVKNNSIEVLPPNVVEKIKAGEVVERPASVLKELVENALDANATKIDIAIEDAGFSLIKVVDNGGGMPPSDLPKSLLPHATSKIRLADDLFSISTLGFRGEALASIAAVSRISVTSSDENTGLGYCVGSDGGVHKNIEPVRHLQGTTVSVRDLFFNIPVRKKFMKTPRSEQFAIFRMVEQIVIPFPSVHFTFTVDGKSVFDLPIAESVRARIAEVGGTDFAKRLVECRGSREGMEVSLYVSSPEQLQPRPRFQCLYVNLQRIDNDSVTYAVREAFAKFLGASNRPSFFCFLNVDPAHIDVNVHPTKQIIKFDEERKLFGFIFGTVRDGIAQNMVSTNDFSAAPEGRDQPDTRQETDSRYTQHHYKSEHTNVHEQDRPVVSPAPFHSGPSDEEQSCTPSPSSQGEQTFLSFPSFTESEKGVGHEGQNTIQLSKDERESWDLIPCFQIHNMYVLAPIKKGILLIDQHAAHERVLFEQALEDMKRGRSASQQLLFPIVLELSPTEKAIIESGTSYFASFGFDIGDFGGQSVSISAIPAFMKDGMVDEAVRGMLRYLMEGRSPESFNEPEKRFAAAFACGAAIKAGQKLSQEEMNALLNSLFSTNSPYTCPHGRPTLVRMSLDELSRRFLR